MSPLKNRRIIFFIYFAIFIVMILFLTFNDRGLLRYFNLKSEISRLTEEIKASDRKLKILNEEIDSLENNKFKIEKVAREKYNMKRQNEKVLRIESE